MLLPQCDNFINDDNVTILLNTFQEVHI